MVRLSLAVVAMIGLAGCEEPVYPKYANDQAVRARLFKECLAALPAGPVVTKYNDWDEVVNSCDSSAYRQSVYCYENCPPARKHPS